MYTSEDYLPGPADLLYDPIIDAWSAVTNHYVIIVKNYKDNYYLVESWRINNETGTPDILFSVKRDSYTPCGSLTLINIIRSFDHFTHEYN